MAFSHGTSATLSIGGTAFAGYIESASMDLSRELAEIRVLDADSVARVAGLKDCSFTSDGAWDPTADAALYALYNGSAPGAIVFSPDGTVTYTVNCWMPNYNVSVGNDKASWSVQLSSDGDVTRA